MFPRPPIQLSRGFSLVELAIVLLIATTFLTLGVTALTIQAENAMLTATQRRQYAIKDALTIYLGVNKRLPCPDIPNAVGNIPGRGDDNRATADDVTTQCSSNVGVVPYIELGLPRDFALDGWENFFTYRVTTNTDTTLDWTRSSSFAVGKPGSLVVSDRNPATNAITILLTGTEKAVVVIVSHGKNGLGAWTIQGTQNVLPGNNTDERENADGTTNFNFISRERTEILVPTYGAYDDFIMFFKASDLIAPLVKDGALRTPEGETVYMMTDVVSRIIGNSFTVVSTPTLPDPLTFAMPNDGWGMPLIYVRVLTLPLLVTTAPGDAFTVTSYGPDRDVGGTDNIVVPVTVDAYKVLCAKAGITL